MVGGARAAARCDVLGRAPYSEFEHGLYRGYLTPAHHTTLDLVGAWMVEAGMHVDLDPAANLLGRYEGQNPGAPALVIGSHLDSVRDGGRYDGPLGVLLGIECVAALNDQQRRLPFAIEVYGFGDEEGSRFPAAMLTSRAVAGTLDGDLARIADADGVSLAAALASFKTDYDVVTASTPTRRLDLKTFEAARRSPGDIVGYLEAHIEQGPVLEAEGLALGIVTGIAAQLRYAVTLRGAAGHAGTSSMPLRRDALAGAAEMVLAVEQVARRDASDLVATVGKFEAAPGAANVIADEVRFSIDIRAGEAARRDRAAKAIEEKLELLASQRGLVLDLALVHDLPASPCDAALMQLLESAMAEAGQPLRRLVSGAGHDAMVMSALCPAAMLFIRCKDGVSHNPAEHVEPGDADVALEVMLGFIERLNRKVLGESLADRT